MVRIKRDLSAVESHNSLGDGEKLPQPIAQNVPQGLLRISSTRSSYNLSLSVKSMNDNINSDGLFPSLLVFGTLRRFPFVNTSLSNEAEVICNLSLTRAEMEIITSRMPIKKVPLANGPLSSTVKYEPD